MIAILGGTFDPIHLGHLHLAKQLQNKLGFDTIRFMPAATPALKERPTATAEQRAEMVKLSIKNQDIENQAHFTLDTQELSRIGPSYTIDTVISLRQELGSNVSLCWLMGSDAFAQLSAWHRWDALLNYVHLIVVKRPHSDDLSLLNTAMKQLLKSHQTHNIDEIKQLAHGKILIQEMTALAISSTEIRNKIANGEDVSALVPMNAYQYIQAHHLYRNH
jgi:nicotinate-nucleotide adenylyltransferase